MRYEFFEANAMEDLEKIKELIEKGIDVNVHDKFAANALHYAHRHDDLAIAKAIIEAGIRINDVNEHGWTPLFLAAINGKLSLVRLLIKKGAYISFRNNSGFSPFERTLGRKHLGVALFFVKNIRLLDRRDREIAERFRMRVRLKKEHA